MSGKALALSIFNTQNELRALRKTLRSLEAEVASLQEYLSGFKQYEEFLHARISDGEQGALLIVVVFITLPLCWLGVRLSKNGTLAIALSLRVALSAGASTLLGQAQSLLVSRHVSGFMMIISTILEMH